MAVVNPWGGGTGSLDSTGGNSDYWNKPEGQANQWTPSFTGNTSNDGGAASPLASQQGWTPQASPAYNPASLQQANSTVFGNLGLGGVTTQSATQPGQSPINGMPAGGGVNAPGSNPSTPAASPWQNISGSINGAPAALAQGLTQGAGQNIANMFGANLATQNLNNMASPGSSAPSAPRYGLDFGYGDIQDAEQVQRWLDRGDSQEQINARLQAGRDNTGWGGVAPQSDLSPFWNVPAGVRASPTATPFGNEQYKANVAGQGNYGQSAGPTAQLGTPPQAPQPQSGAWDFNTALAFLSQLLGSEGLAALFGGGTQRQPPLTSGRNLGLQRNYYYPQSEPTLY